MGCRQGLLPHGITDFFGTFRMLATSATRSLPPTLANWSVCNDWRLSAGKRGRVMVDESDLVAFMEQCRREATASLPPLSLKHISMS